MRLDVIANSLSSIVDITSESSLDAAFLWRECNIKETFVKTCLAVLKEKVVLDSSLGQILCYFGMKGFVEFVALSGLSKISTLPQVISETKGILCSVNTSNTSHLVYVISYFHKLVPFPAVLYFRHLIVAWGRKVREKWYRNCVFICNFNK